MKFDKAEKCDIACKKNPLNFVEFSRGWFHSVISKINLIKLLQNSYNNLDPEAEQETNKLKYLF